MAFLWFSELIMTIDVVPLFFGFFLLASVLQAANHRMHDASELF